MGALNRPGVCRLAVVLSLLLASSLEAKARSAEAEIRKAVLTLYEQRHFEPLWFRDREPTLSGRALLEELRSAERKGLREADYNASHLAAMAQKLADENFTDGDHARRVDVAFSMAAARLAIDLHRGRVDPRSVGHDLDVPQAALDIARTLERLAGAADVGGVLDALEPPFRHYVLLKRVLTEYRQLLLQPDLTRLIRPAGKLVEGDNYVDAAALRRLLRALGDLQTEADFASDESQLLDAPVIDALRRFQVRHGLQSDGVLGEQTFRQLTTPLQKRVSQIVLSLERARWLPSGLDSPPIIVNIPQFRLFAFRTTQDDAKDILQMNVIVGSAFAGRETPVFAADMRYVVLNPYWDVPGSIVRKELMPHMRADSTWVRRNGYEIVRGPGDDAVEQPVTTESLSRLERGELRLRQKPGPGNALGRVKFMFPNRHNVYLHDTPTQALFGEARRAFSHGCIRVADPMSLLRHILRDEPDWTGQRVSGILSSGLPTRIYLRAPIRVIVIYGTALATEAGEVLFFDDIYRHDARLEAMLNSRPTLNP